MPMKQFVQYERKVFRLQKGLKFETKMMFNLQKKTLNL